MRGRSFVINMWCFHGHSIAQPPNPLALEILSAKFTLCSFNSSTPKYMFKATSPCKLGSMYLNLNLGVLEPELVKFSAPLPSGWMRAQSLHHGN